MTTPVSRRAVLAAGAAGAGAIVLAGCGSGDKQQASPAAPATSSPAGSEPPAPSKPLAKVADVPVGGAVSATGDGDAPLILAQPVKGTILAFSARCTHQGCTVAPADKKLNCPCHGSVYDAATGKVLQGPARRPLAKVDVHVVGGEVMPGTA